MATSITNAGQTIGHAQVTMTEPIAVKERLKVRGVADDGAMPINARSAK